MESLITPSKRYYEKNKDTILAREKETKRWVDYYSRNKEAIKERNLQRYYDKAGRPRPAERKKKGPRAPSPDHAKIEKLEALVAELRELVPEVMKPKRKREIAKTPDPDVIFIVEEEEVPVPV